MTIAEKKARIVSLENLIHNYEKNGLRSDQKCIVAIEELDRLKSGGLDLRKTVEAIRSAARLQTFIAYAAIAEASSLPWKQARRPMNPHLDELCRYAHARGWPLITAIVVDAPNLATGEMSQSALDGFIRAANRLEIHVGRDERVFLRGQQEQTFVWAGKATV